MHEFTHHVTMSDAKFILTSVAGLDVTLQAAKTCGIPSERVFVLDFDKEEIPESLRSWKCLLAHGESDWVRVNDPDNTPAAHVVCTLPSNSMIHSRYSTGRALMSLLAVYIAP